MFSSVRFDRGFVGGFAVWFIVCCFGSLDCMVLV